MRKILSLLIIAYLIVFLFGASYAATYYGCNGCTNPTSDTCWTTDPDNTCASCSGSYTAWATVNANGNSLYLNGCAMAYNLSTAALTIPATGALTLLSNKQGADAQSVDGGTLTLTTNASNVGGLTLTTIETGGADLIALAGTAAGADRIILNITSATGGTGVGCDAISDAHSGGGVTANISTCNGGSNGTAYCYHFSGASAGSLAATGNYVGKTGKGFYSENSNAGSSISVNGQCVGSETSTVAVGCQGASANNVVAFTGKLVWGDGAQNSAPPIAGNVSVSMAASDYLLYPVGTDLYLSQGGGGGAWAY